ncbi:MAG: hypothetical protein K2W82_10865 [Candidatus Obscuribacterales bacterium]|nr:hypothetical protein [Candidatus Obscuribacterales bacterium]
MARSQLGYGLHSLINFVNMLKLSAAFKGNDQLARFLDSLVGKVRNLDRDLITLDSERTCTAWNPGRIVEALHNLRLSQIHVLETIDFVVAKVAELVVADQAIKPVNPHSDCLLDKICLENPLNSPAILLQQQIGCLKTMVLSLVQMVSLGNESYLSGLTPELREHLAREYAEFHKQHLAYLKVKAWAFHSSHAGELVASPHWFDVSGGDNEATIDAWVRTVDGSKIRELFPDMPQVFVSGHLDLTAEEFVEHYVPVLDRYVAEGAEFVVGDARGADKMSQDYLALKGAKVTVYHMLEAPRNNSGFPTVGGFKSDGERDAAMTVASNHDLAWVRPGKEKSGTAENIRRRLKQVATSYVNTYARGMALLSILQGRLGSDAVDKAIALVSAGGACQFSIDSLFAALSEVTGRPEAEIRASIEV